MTTILEYLNKTRRRVPAVSPSDFSRKLVNMMKKLNSGVAVNCHIFRSLKCLLQFTRKNSPLWVVKVHSLLCLVVGCYPEWNDLHRSEARGHGEHLSSVGGLVQVLFCLWVRHACWVPANNVEVCSGNHSCSTVPLNLEGIQVNVHTFEITGERLTSQELDWSKHCPSPLWVQRTS